MNVNHDRMNIILRRIQWLQKNAYNPHTAYAELEGMVACIDLPYWKWESPEWRAENGFHLEGDRHE